MKTITQDLFYEYTFLSDLNYNPGKTKAVFVKSNIDTTTNGYLQHLWLYDHGVVNQLTAGAKEANYCWEDDDNLLFSAEREKENDELSTTFYRLNINGGEALKAFTLPLQVSSIKALADHYLVEAHININYSDYYQMSDEEKAKVKINLKDNEDYQIMDEYPYFFNGGGYINATRNSLFIIDKATLKIKPLVNKTLDVESYNVSGCQRFIVLTGIDYLSFKGKWSQVYLYDIKSDQLKQIYDGDKMMITRAFFYNHQIVVCGTFALQYGAMEASKFYLLKDNKMELFIENEGSLYNSVSTDCHYGKLKNFECNDEKPYFISVNDSRSELLKFQDDKLITLLNKEGSCDDFTTGDDHILVIGLYDQKLQEIYRVENGDYQQITHFNDQVLEDRYVAKPQRLDLLKEPFDIHGWVLLPKNYDASRKYPAILDIHGGPKCAYGEVFFHEMQYWVNLGYIVFYCNPRGGDGRGNAFADLRHNFGKIDYEDLMDFTDLILKTYPEIDPKRLAVTGGSYGGYMTNWLIGHTDRFVCAASQRSISNWVTEVTTSDYGIDFVIEQEFADPTNCVAQLWEMSPLKYANSANTPTLFIHSYEDYRCPIQEAMQMYTVLKCRGIDSKIVGFKGENHELSRSGKPTHRSKRLLEITTWINKYTNI